MIEEKLIKRTKLEEIGTLEHFGWHKNLDSPKTNKKYILIERDTEMPYYKEIKAVEEKYNELKKDIIPSYQLITPLFVFLTLMFVVPGFIYKVVVNNHNIKIEENNALIYEKMEEILDKASRYTNI